MFSFFSEHGMMIVEDEAIVSGRAFRWLDIFLISAAGEGNVFPCALDQSQNRPIDGLRLAGCFVLYINHSRCHLFIETGKNNLVDCFVFFNVIFLSLSRMHAESVTIWSSLNCRIVQFERIE